MRWILWGAAAAGLVLGGLVSSAPASAQMGGGMAYDRKPALKSGAAGKALLLPQPPERRGRDLRLIQILDPRGLQGRAHHATGSEVGWIAQSA
jgi:hypothetical protein